MRRHTPEELAEFIEVTAGLTSTWARRSRQDTSGLVFMPAGEGERFKADTRAGLYRCVLPSCDGLLIVSAGQRKRHHWRHRPGESLGVHSPETIWHLAAKAAIAQWARAKRPDASVDIEKPTRTRTSRPDVWVTWSGSSAAPAGDLAFEAQHSSLTGAILQTRSDRYAADGIVPVWLFSHLCCNLSPDTTVLLRDMHRAAAAIGPLRWLNPETRTVATAYVQFGPGAPFVRAPTSPTPEPISYVRHAGPYDGVVKIALDTLDDCELDGNGMHTPTDRWIAEQASLMQDAERRAQSKRERADAPLRPAPVVEDPQLEPPQRAAAPHRTASEERPPRATARPRPRTDPRTLPCPACKGHVACRSEWPRWYQPPASATLVAFCERCQIPVGHA